MVYTKIKSFILQSARVWHILKKPSNSELKTIAKVSAIGMLIIGALGFFISDIIRVLKGFTG
jgi:protein translocase SEC61 complex gamma subunit